MTKIKTKNKRNFKMKRNTQDRDLAGKKVISSHKLHFQELPRAPLNGVERVGKSLISTFLNTNINKNKRKH